MMVMEEVVEDIILKIALNYSFRPQSTIAVSGFSYRGLRHDNSQTKCTSHMVHMNQFHVNTQTNMLHTHDNNSTKVNPIHENS